MDSNKNDEVGKILLLENFIYLTSQNHWKSWTFRDIRTNKCLINERGVSIALCWINYNKSKNSTRKLFTLGDFFIQVFPGTFPVLPSSKRNQLPSRLFNLGIFILCIDWLHKISVDKVRIYVNSWKNVEPNFPARKETHSATKSNTRTERTGRKFICKKKRTNSQWAIRKGWNTKGGNKYAVNGWKKRKNGRKLKMITKDFINLNEIKQKFLLIFHSRWWYNLI